MIRFIDQFINSRWFFWLRIIQFIFAIAIFTFAALMPSAYVPQATSDHTLHFLGNVLLFLSASVALLGRMKLGILALSIIPYSLMIEASQWLTPSRQVDIHDAAANMAGLGLGYLLALLLERTWKRINADSLAAN